MAQLLRAWLMLLLAMLWLNNAQGLPDVQGLSAVRAVPAVQGMQDGLPDILLADLPAEARDTLRAIKQGGPFAYERDGALFKNYERVLPKRARGYYHEYTVKTPNARNRGARRIVCGPLPECYYTADHYRTFKRIREQP